MSVLTVIYIAVATYFFIFLAPWVLKGCLDDGPIQFLIGLATIAIVCAAIPFALVFALGEDLIKKMFKRGKNV